MSKIKEVTIFTNGDSAEIKTWSNVPFFFTETLLSKGIKVNRVNLSRSPLLRRIFNITIYGIRSKINKYTTYDYRRSFIHFFNVKSQIKKAIKRYPESEANIFLTFSHSSKGLSDKPAVLVCDWPYDYFLRHFKNKTPDCFERKSIKRDDDQIEEADLVVFLFKSLDKYMTERYKSKNILYLGQYVINSLYVADRDELLRNREDEYNILFVGSGIYLEGAKSLIEAFREIKIEFPGARLHIVGIEDSNFGLLPEDVICYGYLNKANRSERELFHNLFRIARVYVNTTPIWSGFSATIEAMYSYVPVIVSPYDEFICTFGEKIKFGYYCDENTPEKIAEKIRIVFNGSNYQSLCVNAHDAVKDFTWSSFIDKLIMKIEEVNNK